MTDRGGPPWPDGPPWTQGRWRDGPGRRFRRGAFIALLLLVLLVAVLATLVSSLIAGNAPARGVTVVVTIVVLGAIVVSARWLWRLTRTVGGLMDAADRVAGGDYDVRVRDPGRGQLGRLAGAFNEMTERLSTNEERRTELLADIAHELRSPLQVIRGTTEGMLDGLYPVEPDRLRPIVDETIVMARLLDDLRTLSMAEAGVLPLHRETVDPRTLGADTVRAFHAVADEAGVRLEIEIADDAPAQLEADPVRLAEILANLVTNAVRHTPRGGRVTIVVAASPGAARFEVCDTGPGIPAEQLPFVFDRFVTSADAGGTGLGLTIAKRLTEAHGGTIDARTPRGGGTTIEVVIPTV